MTRETRANLLFLLVFVAISIPGAIIVFKKKLDPAAAPMYLPDPADKRVAYMAPHALPHLKRYIPPRTGQWVESLGGPASSATDAPPLPVMSADRAVQLLSVAPSTTAGSGVRLLLWNASELTTTPRFLIQFRSGPTVVPGRISTVDLIDVPVEVASELIRNGYAKPPTRVALIAADFDQPLPASGSIELIQPDAPAGTGSNPRIIPLGL